MIFLIEENLKILPILLYEASIILIPKIRQGHTKRKLQTNAFDEHILMDKKIHCVYIMEYD